MINPITTTKIFATLGNNSSLIPLGLKDVSNTLGITAGSYVTGNKVEGKDRFIDEFGTQIIWLLGIPFFKKVIDKTIYKMAKLNPNIDTRILKDKEIFEKAKKHALPGLKAGFEKIEKNQKKFKGLAVTKFFVSTALTLGSYSALTVFRHKQTEKDIIDEFNKEESKKQANKKEAIKNNQKAQKNPSFGMNMNVMRQFMFDPVKNTMIVDGGITTERLAESRNPQDFMGYVIKEGGFWAFMYFAGPMIQKHLEKKARKNQKPIDLDIRVLQDEKFQNMIADKSIEKHLKAFSIEGKDADVYERLFENPDNMIVKIAKKSNIIKTVKKTDNIDSQHYIDIDEIKGIKNKTQKIYEDFAKSGKTKEAFFKDIVKLKRFSIAKGIGASVAALGLLIPGIMVAIRFADKDNKEFQVKKEIHEKLRKQNFEGKDTTKIQA